jgi:flagellar hook assembly protein FlgD
MAQSVGLTSSQVHSLLSQSSTLASSTPQHPVTSNSAPNRVHTEAKEGVAPERKVRAFDVASNYPNPFHTTTTISFTLPRDETVTVKVYDVVGRRIATLLDERAPRGSHSITWNGTNDAGLPVTSGVYLYTVEAGPHSFTGKMNLVR